MAATMIGCILMLSVAGTLAGPISWEADSSTCATKCPESVKFAYKPATQYEYQYENDIQTSIPGSTEEQSSLHMRATVQIEVLSPCEFNLKLTDVSLQDSQPLQYESRQHVDNAWEFKRLLQEKGLRFGFIDGEIEHVCPEDEPVWVLNIKRGILSAFQNTQRTLDAATKGRETDVSGDCPVEYSLGGSTWSVKKVKKVKNMLGCSDRHGADTSFTGSPYEIDSSIQSLPLMKTTHECDQEINSDGVLIQTMCRELHVFRPLSDGQGGPQTSVTYKLAFTKQSRGVQTTSTPIRRRASLLFDHTLSEAEKESKLTEATETMRALCASVKDEDVRPETPRLFAELVRLMRTLDARAMQRLQASVASMCPQAEKYFRDAIPNIGTAASLTLIRNLISQGRVEDSEAAVWLTHLAFVPQPSREMLGAVSPLLRESGEIQRKAALSISSMVHNYCRMDEDCAQVDEVKAIIKIFTDNLSYNCRSDGDAQKLDTIRMALKALGNTGNALDASQTLVRCFQNDKEPVEVRVAAIQAFRRMSCNPESMELMRVFGDETEDSEVRINAYLMLMNCPNEDIVNQIQRILSDEQVNQVGSFVYSHLTNLMESSDPSKRELREILQSIDLKVFDLDMRKFSRNTEWSLFSDMVNTGAKAESNVIFSSESYIPRSAMVNMSVDLFGHSVNLFEFGGRVEGLEQFIESMFRSYDNSVRQKRDVIRPSLLEHLDHQFKVAEHDGPKASYFFKIFGNEIHYNDFRGLDLEQLKDKMNFVDWLIKLSQDQQLYYTKSMMFLDSELVVPTAVGLPLRLAIDGAATVNVKMDGKMDVRQMFSNPSTVDLNGSIKPSAAVEVCSEMVVDAFVAKTGLKMVSTIHSSTVTQGRIALLDGKVFHFDLEMPRDKQEIISTQNKFFVLYREEQREQRMIEQGRASDSECYDLTKALGIEVCGEVSLPILAKENVAKYPFTGPSSAAIYINKKDTFSKYHVGGSLEVDKRSSETEFKLNINTPGSKVEREIDIFFNLNPAQKTVDLNMKSPWKKATMRGEVTNTESMKRVSATATVDDRRTYSFVSEVAIEAKKYGVTYTPKMELALHNQPVKSLGGQIFYRDNKKFEIDLALTNVFQKPVTAEGSVSKVNNDNRMKYVISVDITSSALKGKVDGFMDLDKKKDTFSSRVTFGYKNAKNKNERITWSNKASDKSTKTLTSWSLTSGLTTTLWPRYDTDMKVDFTYGRQTFNAKLDAGFDEQRRIMVTNSASMQSSPREMTMNAATMLEVPYKNLKYELTVDHLHNQKVFNSKATVGYHNQIAEARIDAKRESTDPVNAYAKAFLTYPGREMSISHTINEKRPNEYHNDVIVQLDRNTQATGNVVLKMKQGLYDMSGDFDIPSLKPIQVEGQYKPDMYDFQVGAAAKYDNRKYHGAAEWSVPRNLRRDFEGTHSISFGCPTRSMKLSGKLSKRAVIWSGEHELMMDMERHPDRKINTEWSVTLNPVSPKVFAKAAWFPSKFVQMEAEGSYETEGWYRTSNDLQGSIKFTSSFPMLENINANIKHDYGHDEIKSSGKVSWGRGQTITAALDFNKNTWRDVDASVTVGTPFPGFRTMKMLGNYKLAQKLDSMASFEWEQQMMKIQAKGSADLRRHMIEGEASFTSPFRRFEALSISGKHQDNGRNFNSNVDLSWGRNRKMTATLTMEHLRNGFSVNNNGEINFNTPFTGFQRNKITWTHMNKDNSVKTRIDTRQDSISRMVSLDGSLDSNPRKTELEGNFMLQTPWIADGRIKVHHVHTQREVNTDWLVQWERDQVIEYNHNIQYQPDRFLEAVGKLTTPFRGYNEMTIESKTTKNGRKINTNNEIKWSPNAKINVDGTTTLLGGPKFDTNLRVTTPFSGWERTVLNAKNDYTNEVWESHADLDIARRHYEIDTSLGMDSRKKLSIDTTKMDYGFMLDAEFSGQPRDFTTLLNGKIPYYDENPVGAELRVTCADLDNIKSSLTINTPWRKTQTIKATLGHKQPATGKFITDASFEMPRYKGSVSNIMNLNKWSNFDTKSTVQYQNKKIELTTEAKDRPNLEGTVTFTCPFTEPISLIAKHAGTLRDFQSGVEVSYRDGKKVSADVEYTRRGTNVNAMARVVTPYTQRMVAKAKHNGPWKNFENDASLEYGSQRLAGSSRFNLNGYDLDANVALETPFDEMRTMKAEYQHAGPLNDFTCNSALTVNGRKGTHSMEFKNAKVMSGKAEINTPFPAARLLKAEFNHDAKKWNSFKNDGSFQWNNKEWSGNSELRWLANTLKVVGKLRAPSDTYLLKVNHKGNRNDFTNSAVVDLSSGQKYSAESSFDTKPNGMEGKFSIETPHESFDKMSGHFSQSSDRKTFTANAELKTPFKEYKRFAGDVSHTGSLTNFRSTLNIETPFRKLPSATFAVTHDGDLSEFASTAEAKYGRKTISGAANFKQTARSMEGSASLQTPYPGYEKFEGSFSQSGPLRNFKTSAEIQTPFQGHERYAGSLEHTGGSLANFKSSAELNTPFRGYERTAFKMNHNGDFSGMNTGATLETSIPNYDKFDFSINHNGDPKNVRTMLKFNTPIRDYEEFAVNVNHVGDVRRFESSAEMKGLGKSVAFGVNHNGNLRNFNTKLTATLPVRGYENWGITVTHSGDLSQFQCTADITTPFRQVPELKLGVNHRGSLTDFANGISAEWNRKKMDAQAVWKYESTYYGKNYEGSLKVNTPWQDIDMSGQHKREGETKTGSLKVQHNQVQKVNLDYTYTTGANKNIRVTFTEPKIFELLINFEGNGPSFKSDATFEWERKTNVKVELEIKNQMSGDNVDRQVTFKTSMPLRVIGFDVTYVRNAEKMSQTTEIQWNRDQKMNYALELGSSNYRRQNYDGSFKFNSPVADFETTFSHVMQSQQQTTTTVSITMDETLTIKRECTKHASGMKLIFTLSHPRFSRDAILAVDATMNDKVTEGEIDVQFEREAINFKGKISDEASSASEMKYAASSQLSYPNMRLDMQFDGTMYNDRAGCGGEMELNYQTSRDGMKTATSKLSYDKQRRNAVYELVSPMATVKVTGTQTIHDSYNGVHMFEIVAEKDNEAVRTEFGLDMSGRKIEAKFYTARDAMLHIYAMYSRPSAEFKVMRRLGNGQEVNDVLLNLNLDSDELVTGAAYMRPGVWEDIKELFNNPQFQAKMQRSFEPLKRAMWQEWQQKQAAWERVSERPRAAYNAIYEDMSNVASKINRGVYRAYRANEFHLKDMYDAASDAYMTTAYKMQQAWKKTKAVMGPVMEKISVGMDTGVYMMHVYLENIYRDGTVMYRQAYQKVRAMYQEYRPYVDRAIVKVKMTYKQVKDQVTSYYNQVRNHPKVKAMIETIQDLQPSDVFAPLRKLKFRMSSAVQKWRQEHQEVFDALEDVWNNIAQRQEIRDMAMFIEATLARAQRFWDKYDVQKNMKVWLKNLSKANWKNVKKMVMTYVNDEIKLDKTRWTTYDPKNGNYEFEVYMPYDLKEMDKLPRVNIYSYIRQAQRVMDDMSFDEEWCIWDTIYKYMPRSLNVRDWIPPFKSHATLAGSQHYMTFDKKFYEFSGECSYLLARDFIDGYFSVIANYQSQSGEVSKKSMTVFCKDKQVEVFPDGQVMLDGRRAEMPLEVEGTIIKRVASMIFINNPNGINIDCDLVHDRCTVAVSGWYFGKTGGLLGTYDNEPISDLMKPDNTLANTVEEMAESWIVGSRCRATNYAKVTRVDEDSPKYKACAKYFTETTSPFRPCFKQVDPELFMTMCLNDEEPCDATSYYVNECKKNRVTIRQPRECVTCEVPSGGQLIEGGGMTLTTPPNSGDVVFVVQRGDCNREVMSKITDLVNYFERTFQEAGMRDVHYGIVGFGGMRPHDEPHTQTISGRVMTPDTRMLLRSLESLTYDGPRPEDADVMSAVRFAAMYPFRMGVSKTVVVLPCADCREGATRYTELQRILIERDIRLHLLMDHTFKLKGTKSVTPKSGRMFGQDQNGLFIDKHVSDNDLLGDAALRKQVTRPKDLCAALSEVSDGTVFDREMLANQRPNVQKSFIDVFVRLVVKKAAPSQCQKCECVSDNAMSGQAICHHCEMNPIYNLMPDFGDYEYEDESMEQSSESSEEVEEIPLVRQQERQRARRKFKLVERN